MNNIVKAALVAVAVLAVMAGVSYLFSELADLTNGASRWVFLAAFFGFVLWVSYSAFQEIDRELTEADREADAYDIKEYARERAIGDLIRERTRQIEREGFTPERDADVWPGGELANAAACYALNAGTRDGGGRGLPPFLAVFCGRGVGNGGSPRPPAVTLSRRGR